MTLTDSSEKGLSRKYFTALTHESLFSAIFKSNIYKLK